MAQDTALLRYLLKWARRAPWSWSQRDLAFEFDWTNDYISSNATIGRTGYDMNVAWNVSTGSDGDGSYIQFNGNRDGTAVTGTVARLWPVTALVFTQATSFTIKAKFKFTAFPTNNASNIIWSAQDAAIYINTTQMVYWLRGSSTVTSTQVVSINTLYDMYLVYDATTAKYYWYLGTSWWVSTLLNVWWTSWPATFSADNRYISDNGILSWNESSSNKYIYHAAIRNKALTQAEIDADIALWNTTKNDPSIVAYYIPDNLQYNTQYIANPKDLTNASRAKFFSCTATANTTVAPDGTTTADTVTFIANHNSQTYETNASVTWSALASKTFIIKVFVKVASWTKDFRLKLSHVWVTDYQSGNLSATTTWQEFTFTQTFTSSTAGTWINIWVMNASTAVAWDIQVRNVRVYLTNETLRDESPNIWWFIGRKTPLVMSARIKPWVDASDTTSSQVIIKAPRHYLQLRTSTNILYFRSETSLEARGAPLWWTAILWTWNRNKVHILWVKYRDWTGRRYKSYVNWVLTSWSQTAYSTTLRPASTIYTTQLLVWKDNTATYYTWDIRDIRAYTFTWSFTDADALAIYNGGEPTSSGVTKYLHYRPPVWEVWTTTQDQSTNDRDWTLNGWVTRNYI